MEAGINGQAAELRIFSETPVMSKGAAARLSPVTLSLVGDAVFELYIRTVLLLEGNHNAEHLHREKIRLVNAAAQAAMLQAMEERLTQAERDIVRRGRNAKHHSTAKNQSIRDYNLSSGLEALCGYLYLSGETVRLRELLAFALLCVRTDANKRDDADV